MDWQNELDRFFAAYAARMNAALEQPPREDLDATASAFAEYCVAASPKGVFGAKNDDAFRKHFPEGYAFYRSIGTQWMKVVSISPVEIDPLHVLARVHWDSFYIQQERHVRIEFDVNYLLQRLDGTLKIFAWVSGDEQDVLRRHGLLPPT